MKYDAIISIHSEDDEVPRCQDHVACDPEAPVTTMAAVQGFADWGLEIRVQGLGFQVWGSGIVRKC